MHARLASKCLSSYSLWPSLQHSGMFCFVPGTLAKPASVPGNAVWCAMLTQFTKSALRATEHLQDAAGRHVPHAQCAILRAAQEPASIATEHQVRDALRVTSASRAASQPSRSAGFAYFCPTNLSTVLHGAPELSNQPGCIHIIGADDMVCTCKRMESAHAMHSQPPDPAP